MQNHPRQCYYLAQGRRPCNQAAHSAKQATSQCSDLTSTPATLSLCDYYPTNQPIMKTLLRKHCFMSMFYVSHYVTRKYFFEKDSVRTNLKALLMFALQS